MPSRADLFSEVNDFEFHHTFGVLEFVLIELLVCICVSSMVMVKRNRRKGEVGEVRGLGMNNE